MEIEDSKILTIIKYFVFDKKITLKIKSSKTDQIFLYFNNIFLHSKNSDARLDCDIINLMIFDF